MMNNAQAIMTKRTKPGLKLATAQCLNPNCLHEWVIRTAAPKKCPKCFLAKVKVKGV
jgi:hypothetical protein